MMRRLEGRCYLTQTQNNIFVVLVDEKSQAVKYERSGGKLGYKGASKRTRLVAELIGKEVGEKGLEKGYREVKVSIRGGITALTRGVVNGLVRGGLKVKEVEFMRSIAHNGVRPRKARRV